MLTVLLYPVPRLRMRDAVPLVPHTPSERVEKQLFHLICLLRCFTEEGDTSSKLVNFIRSQFFEIL